MPNDLVDTFETFAPSHRGKVIKHCRQFFAAAIKDHVIESNPFAETSTAGKKKEREHYLSREDTTKLLTHCPEQLWRVIIVLARYGGLFPSQEFDAIKQLASIRGKS